jgi:hypothetical protein
VKWRIRSVDLVLSHGASGAARGIEEDDVFDGGWLI